MKLAITIMLGALLMSAQDGKIRVIAFGAHPDDCDIRAAGTARLWAQMGHAVKFVAIANGDAGHQSMPAADLAKRRLAEAKESGRRLGVEYEVLGVPDGEIMPTLETRKQIIRLIREWKADLVLAPRPNDYHPDHRYTGVLVQDAAYLVVVPKVAPDVPALRKNPVFMYYEDGFQRPNPFRPDVAVAIDDVIDRKVEALDAHVSQFYEWLPWVDGNLDAVPSDPQARKTWLKKTRANREVSPEIRAALVKWYGADKGNTVRHYEAFEVCEYGAHPDDARLRQLFPMLR